MIVIKYRGGLGNQMFQYAFQLAVQKRYSETEILGDISHYRMQEEHNGFELEKVFHLSILQPNDKKLRSLSPYYVPSNCYDRLPEKIKYSIAHNFQYKYYDIKRKRKTEGYYKQQYHNSYEEQVFVLPLSHDWYLDGLWQDIRYFKDCEDEVRKAFHLNNVSQFNTCDLEYISQIEKENSVGIHVRRGDFVNSKFDICSMEYYKDAVKKAMGQIENPKFFIFTDDIKYVKEEFSWLIDKTIIQHDINNSICDMEMLSKCHHKIISNSTFAFWSAWLGKQHKALIIAPKNSIVKADKKYELRTPTNWIQI